MFNFNLSLYIPSDDSLDNIFLLFGRTWFKNKFWELQAVKTNCLLLASLSITTKYDHAGIRLSLGLLSYEIHFNIYDNRHWNHEKGCWESENSEGDSDV